MKALGTERQLSGGTPQVLRHGLHTRAGKREGVQPPCSPPQAVNHAEKGHHTADVPPAPARAVLLLGVRRIRGHAVCFPPFLSITPVIHILYCKNLAYFEFLPPATPFGQCPA